MYEKVMNYFLDNTKPNVFDPDNEENVLFLSDSQTEDLYIGMQENGIPEPKELTVFEFYKRIQYYEKKRPTGGTSQ